MAGRRLRVRDVFQFANGQVVFAGELDGDASLVAKGSWRVEINGVPGATLTAVGEMIPERRNPNAPGAGWRAISFEGPVEVDALRRDLSDVILLEI